MIETSLYDNIRLIVLLVFFLVIFIYLISYYSENHKAIEIIGVVGGLGIVCMGLYLIYYYFIHYKFGMGIFLVLTVSTLVNLDETPFVNLLFSLLVVFVLFEFLKAIL